MKSKSFQSAAVVLLILIAMPSLAQMSLVATSPSDGTVAFDPGGTLTVTFSQPMDTSARFETENGPLFLGIELHPSSKMAAPQIVTFSADMKSARFHNMQLHADTKYTLIIAGAKSTGGELLETHHIITFSTGAALSEFSVNGTVSFPGGDPRNAVALLMSSGEEGPEFFGASVIAASDGQYSIPYVDAGDYMIGVVFDSNDDDYLDPVSGDVIGFYDANNDFAVDMVTVDGTVNGVDVTISEPSPVTIQNLLPAANILADLSAPDAKFAAARSDDISMTGEAAIWQIYYFSAVQRKFILIMGLGVFTFPVTEFDDEDDLGTMPDIWVDSDAALTVTEDNGGGQFRLDNPNSTISAVVGPIDFIFFAESGGDGAAKAIRKGYAGSRWIRFSGISIPPHLQEDVYWMVTYTSDDYFDQETFFLDAASGDLFLPMTARQPLAEIDQMMHDVAADAGLTALFSAGINMDGTGSWYYIYESVEQSKQYVYASFGPFIIPTIERIIDEFVPQLPVGWIDSDEAMSLAEAAGGQDFRALYPDSDIEMILRASIVPTDVGKSIGKSIADPVYSRATIIDLIDSKIKRTGPDMAKTFQGTEIQRDIAHWIISYVDWYSWEYLDVFLDAINGIALGAITAQDPLTDVTGAASYWAEDAVLVYLTTFFTMIDENGKADFWMYQFYSPAKDSTFTMWVTNGVITNFQQYPGGDIETAIPENWINSPQAIAAADSYGGDTFRAANDSIMVSAMLAVMEVSEGAMMPVWLIQYASDSELLEIMVDALNGAIITDVHDPEPGSLAPESYVLEQNFPNPFNPQTTISYNMQKHEHVIIRIIDLMGREIIRLVDEKKSPGNYKVLWDARDGAGHSVSTGVYIYEMKAGSFSGDTSNDSSEIRE